MATNWLTLTGADLLEVIAQVVHRKSNENVSPDIAVSSNPPTALDPDAPNRADRLAQRTVARIRGYVQKTGQQAVSVTPGTIPPDCWDAAADVAAWRLVVSTPGLQMAVLTEKGVYAPLQKRHDLGEEYLKRLAKGETVVDPPTRAGWTTRRRSLTTTRSRARCAGRTRRRPTRTTRTGRSRRQRGS